MICCSGEKKNMPYIIERQGIITAVSQQFADLAEYPIEEIINKNIEEVFRILRIGPNVEVKNMDKKAGYFLFTKSVDARFVHIEVIKETEEQIFFFREKPNSRLEDKFSYVYQLLSENVVGISIYSAPDFTLLKANQVYLDFLQPPFNTPSHIFGKQMINFITKFNDSPFESILKNAVSTGKSEYLKEFIYDKSERGITYWDQIITPVKEDGKVKYIVVQAYDITDRKKAEESLERSNQRINEIVSSIQDDFYVLDRDWNFVYANKNFSSRIGKESKDFIGNNIWDMFPKHIGTVYEENVRAAMDKREIRRFEMGGNYTDAFYRMAAFPSTEGITVLGIDITEQKRMEEDLQQQKDQLQAIIQNISEGLTVIDKHGRFTIINDTVKKILESKTNLGTTVEHVGETMEKGQKYYDEYGKEILARDLPSYRVLKGVKVQNQHIILMNGSDEIHFDFSASPVFDKKGEFQFGVITSHDVTDLIQKDREIKRQQEHLKVITENMTDGLMIINPDGSIPYMNERAYEMAFQPETYKKYGDSLLHTKYFDESGKEISKEEMPGLRIFRGEFIENYILKVVRPDKIIFLSFNGKPVYLNGKLACAILCIRDITERYRYEQIIKQQKVQLEAIIENMSDAFAIYNREGRMLQLNAEARKMHPHLITKSSVDDVHGNFLYYDLKNSPIEKENLPTRRAFRGETVRNERIMIKKPAQVQYIEINATPIFDNDNNLDAVAISHRDITQEIVLQKAEKDKNEALKASMTLKDEFLYLITHEFKTPLAVINSALQTMDLLCKHEMPVKATKFLNSIRQNTNRQLRLVNNLLDITRISAGQIKLNRNIFDIVFLTRSIVNSVQVYAGQKKIAVNFTTKLIKKEILIDEEKFERILLNLLSNALKFTPGGKSINVTLCTKRHNNRKMVCIHVQDKGIGIPRDKQAHIFERFGQADTSLSRQAEGTGIGLYLVKLLVNAMDGHIMLQSEEGKGSTFTVMLPATKALRLNDSKGFSNKNDQFLQEESRLISALAIEFSDIYL